jgi:hypothetical protein
MRQRLSSDHFRIFAGEAGQRYNTPPPFSSCPTFLCPCQAVTPTPFLWRHYIVPGAFRPLYLPFLEIPWFCVTVDASCFATFSVELDDHPTDVALRFDVTSCASML